MIDSQGVTEDSQGVTEDSQSVTGHDSPTSPSAAEVNTFSESRSDPSADAATQVPGSASAETQAPTPAEAESGPSSPDARPDGQTSDTKKSAEVRSKYATYTVEELKRRRRQFTIIEFSLIILALILAWASFGMMMRTGFMPAFDLGYSWFDEHIVYFFGITAGSVAA